MKTLARFGCAMVISTAAFAQSSFRADLAGTEIVPPVTTFARAFAAFTLNADGTLTYAVHALGLSGTEAHVHVGAAGEEGPILFTLDGGPLAWSGTTAVLDVDAIARLRGTLLYVDVHTTVHPEGEIRAQIVARPRVFGAFLDGSQQVPPDDSAATGQGTFTVNEDLTITYLVTTPTLADAFMAMLSIGDVGEEEAVVFALGGGPFVWSGTTWPMPVDYFDRMQNVGFYVNVYTLGHDEGEIRGQLLPSGMRYGIGRASSTGQLPTLDASGAPTPGGELTLAVDHGKPFGFGLLLGSLQTGAQLVATCPFYLGPLVLTQAMPLLDAQGHIAITRTLPAIPASVPLFLQYLGADPLLPGGIYATNGLELRCFVFP